METIDLFINSNVDDMPMLREILRFYMVRFPHTDKVFNKVSLCEDIETYETEVQCLSRLEESGFTPKLIDKKIISQIRCIDSANIIKVISNYFITLIQMERVCGKTINELYIPEQERSMYLGPGIYIKQYPANLKDIREIIPEKYVSDAIIIKIVEKLNILVSKYGIYHEDIHSGNFIEKDGEIVVIDFECSKIVKVSTNRKDTSDYYR